MLAPEYLSSPAGNPRWRGFAAAGRSLRGFSNGRRPPAYLGQLAIPDLERGQQHREKSDREVGTVDDYAAALGGRRRVGHDHHDSADDIEALREGQKVPGPRGMAPPRDDLDQSDDREQGEEHREPPLLRRERIGFQREDQQGNDLQAEQDRYDYPARDECAEHCKGLPPIVSLVKLRSILAASSADLHSVRFYT